MRKNLLSLFLCGIMLICFAACSKSKNDIVSNDASSNMCQSEIEIVSDIESETESNDKIFSVQSVIDMEVSSTPKETEKPIGQKKTVFEIKNIASITFYAYYGGGKGSKVPDENMAEITKWLGTFVAEKKIPNGPIPPGTNTYYVEIEYNNGKVIKQGLSTVEIDGVVYYMESDSYPDCFMEIISKTSL